MAKTTILNSNVTISDYTMACIADCMDAYLYKLVARDCAPCSNEWFIAEYARRLSLDERRIFTKILLYNFDLKFRDIAYKAYRDRYDHTLISYARLIWLETACPYVIKAEGLGETWKRNDARAYVISMISGDFIVYAREEEEQ